MGVDHWLPQEIPVRTFEAGADSLGGVFSDTWHALKGEVPGKRMRVCVIGYTSDEILMLFFKEKELW